MKTTAPENNFVTALALSAAIIFTTSLQVYASSEPTAVQAEATGIHGGQLLIDGDTTVELAMSEQGEKSQYQAWVTRAGLTLQKNLTLTAALTRLDGTVERFTFNQSDEDDWLSSGQISEPHSFDVVVTLNVEGQELTWEFASYEGRTTIKESIAEEAGIKVKTAGPGEINQTVTVYGKAVTDPSSISHVRARFPGAVTRVAANIGDRVEKGDVLAEIESNESLKRYPLKAPFAGVITARHATQGEQTSERALFTVSNFDQVWAEFQVFPGQVQRVAVGQIVAVSVNSAQTMSMVKHLIPSDSGQPFVLARAPIDNTSGMWTPGLLLVGKVTVDQFQALLVVDNKALQTLGNETVAFIKVGDSYQARPLQLGRSDGRFTEVLKGLNVGDQYVVDNSYLIKADLEKSGASHSH